MNAIARFLTPAVGRIVLNDTGISGDFSFDLEFSPMRLTAGPSSDVAGDAKPSLFTALRERLGLSLEPARAPMRVLIVDDVSKPTDD
jgi:uncharacterized protein (TIGR03435 family)